MSKIRIYGKNQDADPPELEFINDVVEHYCTNGMFYVKTRNKEEYYFALELIAMIGVEPEESEIEDTDAPTIIEAKEDDDVCYNL